MTSCEHNCHENIESVFVSDIALVLAIILIESFIVLFFRALVTMIAIFSRVLVPHSTSTW